MRSLTWIKGLAVPLLTVGLMLILGVGPASADPLWAVVRYDGSLAAGKNVESVTRLGPGSYAVEFTRKTIGGCAYVGTLGGSAPFEFAPAGQISVSPYPGLTGVWVVTRTSDGFLSDRPFHLKVFC
jgi:hypothetical protein